MIICDADNISRLVARPRQEDVDEEWRKQTEALKDVRRRLRVIIGPRAVGTLMPRP